MEFSGAPFVYNPDISNVNIDNQLAGILSQFNEDYIMDVVKDSLENSIRVYAPRRPNIVSAYETTFKDLTNGFSSNTDEILNTRARVYNQIISIICNFYNFNFVTNDDTIDLYSAAYWLYDFFVSNYTKNMVDFYVTYIIKERDGIYNALDLANKRKDNDPILGYSKKIFKDPKLAAIHCDIDYVLAQMETFDIDLWTILTYVYAGNTNVPSYIYSLIQETVSVFRYYYEKSVLTSAQAPDLMVNIKLQLQQLGSMIEPEAN